MRPIASASLVGLGCTLWLCAAAAPLAAQGQVPTQDPAQNLAQNPAPAQAEPPAEGQGGPDVSAAEPAGLVIALLNAGYDPELTEDGIGDPLIVFSRPDGYRMQLWFFGCDEQTHAQCESLQLRAGFDRAEPWTPAGAMEISRRLRFAAVRLDDEGDPWLSWDIMTRGGIPEALFVEAVRGFEGTVIDAADIVFEDEGGAASD